MSGGILAGVRVVDLSTGLAGPVATLLLAEAGADVVKVEPPAGDPTRAHAAFATWNRSKRSVVLDLDTDGRAALDRLLGGADVLVHDLTPGRANAVGLGDASLTKQFPTLVVCSVTGYSVSHLEAERPGDDVLVQARSGLMDEQRGHREGPVFLRFPVPSWGAAYLAAIGIAARLLVRRRTGRGGPVNTSLLQGALTTLTMHWARAERPTDAFVFGLPKELLPSLYECADGVWLHVMAPPHEVPLVKAALEALGPDEVERLRAESPPSYFGDYLLMQAVFGTRPSAEWLEALWAADVPVLPAQRLGEILLDEQAVACGYVVEVDDPVHGPTRQAGVPLHVDPPVRVCRPAPRLGEHTDEVLGEQRMVVELDTTGGGLRHPLEGVRVVDFGSFLAGPFGSMLLADLGADVVKPESPAGELMRGVERVFAGCNRGKRSIALDLKNPAARDVVEALAAWADVVHHNLRMPSARSLGIDPESLLAVNPRLVYCHTSAYGPTGPRADWPGYDQLFQAYSGWEVEGGGEGNPPMWHRMGMMDHQAAMASALAVLLALYRRDETGQGQVVSASILGASVLTASETLALGDGSFASYPRLDADQTCTATGYGIYRAADGWLAVAAVTPDQLDGLRRVAGVEGDDGNDDIAAALAGRPAKEVTRSLAAEGVPVERVRLAQEEPFFDSPHNRHARLAVTYPHPAWGQLEQIGALWDFGFLSLRLERAPATLGQHTAEILAELGFDDEEVARLAKAGAVSGDGIEPSP